MIQYGNHSQQSDKVELTAYKSRRHIIWSRLNGSCQVQGPHPFLPLGNLKVPWLTLLRRGGPRALHIGGAEMNTV